MRLGILRTGRPPRPAGPESPVLARPVPASPVPASPSSAALWESLSRGEDPTSDPEA